MADGRQPIRNHRDLTVWQKAMVLRRRVHLIVAALPAEARWDVGRQARRAALAIPANIAEGHSHPSRNDYRQYLSIARGENGELDTHIRAIAEDYPQTVPESEIALALIDQISRMLTAMIKKL
jgi:four helix bundle protein